MRTFLAAKIPLEIRDKIENLINEIKSEIVNRRGVDQIKWVKPENIHITIYFFGNIGERDFSILSKKLPLVGNDYSPFEVAIKTVSAFPKPERPRVIWCGIEDKRNNLKKANDLVKDLIKTNNLNIEIDDREYSPHLTIGRLKGKYSASLVQKLVSLESRQFGKFTIDELILFSSTLTRSGPIYKEIERYPLRRTE